MKTKSITISKINNGSFSSNMQDCIVNESPLQIILTYGAAAQRKTEPLSVTMRTPGDDFDLVTGFLFCEGIIKNASDILSLNQINAEQNTLLVELSPDVIFNPEEKKRNFIATSACGFCGKSVNDIYPQNISASNNNEIKISASTLYKLPSSLQTSQNLFAETGGSHAVALVNTSGEFIQINEDVGRHNAMDKLVGAMLNQNALPLNNSILLFSGRLGYELVQKAVAAGISVICSIGAPTSLAIEIAQENNITVVGFLKNQSFNIYCDTKKIIQL
jgi:FdhD protein